MEADRGEEVWGAVQAELQAEPLQEGGVPPWVCRREMGDEGVPVGEEEP